MIFKYLTAVGLFITMMVFLSLTFHEKRHRIFYLMFSLVQGAAIYFLDVI